jgi:integrase
VVCLIPLFPPDPGRLRLFATSRISAPSLSLHPVPLPTWYQSIPRYMTQTEVRACLCGIKDQRDRALFSTIYLYGLRVSEVTLLERGDVDLERARIVIRRVKGGVWTERPLFSSVRELLMPVIPEDGSDKPLFPGRSGPLKKRRIQALFTYYRDLAGLSVQYSCHSLRHSIATHLLDADLPLEFVQDHLGHRKISSTTIYARITDNYRASVFRKLEISPWIVRPTGTQEDPR